MPLTKAQFRERVREQIGDPVRVSGTATGGSLTTLIDTNRLTQIDGYWMKLWAFITDTDDDLAPKGEARKVAEFANATKQLTMELPFSAAVAAGDTYGIAVFSDTRINNIVSGVLKEFSDYRPKKFSENLAVTANEKRFSPTSAAVIRYVEKVEKYVAGSEDTRYNFTWNKSTRQIEFPQWFGENTTLTLYAAKAHTLPAADGDTMTYDDDDEDRLLRWCGARALMSMAVDEFRDNFGKLTPKSWTDGKVSETHGDSREQVMKHLQITIDEIKKSMSMGISLIMGGSASSPTGNIKIDYQGDPDGQWIPPSWAWRLAQ